ncbi:MAG: hypothetical protein KGL39_46915 [Patescibacteria group bacterium]|nr:hypothetical protein [Patescibacteria group bacterium]
MFANPAAPNLSDFYGFALAQGVPASDLPSGSLTTVAITTGGAITASSVTGTVSAGQILYGTGIPDGTYLATWSGLAGTVLPIPSAAVSEASAQAYSPYAAWALNVALITALPGTGSGAGLAGLAGMYVLAVYNLAMHQLLKTAQDLNNQTFFAQTRQTFKLGSLVPGPVMASGDQATSETLVVPDFFKTLTLSEIDLIKTPYGREYLGYAQMYGPTIVGVS